MFTHTQDTAGEGDKLERLRTELDRLNTARNHAMGAYILYLQAQRGLIGGDLQKAMDRTAEAEEAFERINAQSHAVEMELAACKRELSGNSVSA